MDVVVDCFSEGLAEDPSRKELAGIVQNCTIEMELQAWPQDIYQQQLQDKGRCPVLTCTILENAKHHREEQEQPEPERGAALLAGEQFQALLTSTCGQRAWGAAPAPLGLSRALGRAGCGKPPLPRQLGAGRLLPGSLPAPCYGCPRPGGLQRPSVPARRPHTPACRRYRCLLPAGSRSRLARESGAARQGRVGPGRAGGASAAGGGLAWGRRRGGAGRPRPRPRPVRGSSSSQPRCPVPSAPVAAAHEVKMVIRVFVASSSGSVAIKKRQQDVVRFLEANRIEFEEVDITMSEEKRQWMYKNIPEDRQPAQGNPLPPQIFSDDRYCGDYDGFFESKESNTVFSFLGLKPTLASKESEP
ncbi:SH3 domain-binding glutamic acid-rich-like protein 2 [Zonotrichia leucophrys gambelii]|uniref:SH3 domain-binding glutamic acid-rich-like protein 2 n=1 Tax=Zonotrichia leucophrys gambelii TaxID=257770 RepID=UPI0031404E52